MVEKLTEIGISKIIFIITSNSERKKIKNDRLEKKIISAMKQCNSLFKTEIDKIYNLNLFLKKFKFKNKFVADIEPSSLKIEGKNKGDSIIMIGPEGDFTSAEKSLLFEEGYQKISLGSMILRTETAAVVGGFLLKNKGIKE
jgi:16S rRNA (uracil1498-N3)-methyltransferase